MQQRRRSGSSGSRTADAAGAPSRGPGRRTERLDRLPVLAAMGNDHDVVDRDLTEEDEETEPAFFASPKRLLQTGVVVLLLLAAIYVFLPKIVGIKGAVRPALRRDPAGSSSRSCFDVAMFFSYVALFRGVVGERVAGLSGASPTRSRWRAWPPVASSPQAGAGGIVLTYWALRKAGMERRQTAQRMVAFLVLLYAVYMVALVVFGVLLRVGVLSGEAPGRA